MANYKIPTKFRSTTPNSKATFRPGGDAAYVSYLLGGIINEIADFTEDKLSEGEDFATYIRRAIRREAENLGFSGALKYKFLVAAKRILQRELDRQAKADVKAARKALKAKREVIGIVYSGVVKVGRWEYPAREIKYSDDTELVQRNAKRDGSGEWIDLP